MGRSRNTDSSRRDFLRARWLFGDDDARRPGPDAAVSRDERRRQILPQGPPPPCLRLDAPASNPCVGCEAPCVDACEPRIIRRHDEGHSLAGRAYLGFERAGCTWCGDCLEVCPETPPAERRVTVIGQALLNQRTCLPWQGAPCTSCRDVCPVEAILFDDRGRPMVKAAACDGCGMCVAPCPTDAFRVVPVRAGA